MTNYEIEIIDLLPGGSPKQKHDKLKIILQVINDIAYPRRGTPQEHWTSVDFANYIIEQEIFQSC